MQIANRIRAIRKAHNLTQADVAYKADISPSAYGQIERKAANSTFETLSRVAKAIGVSVAFLIDIDNFEYMEKKNKL